MPFWWLNLAGSTIGFTVGSLLLSQFGDAGTTMALAVSFAVLVFSNLFIVQVIRSGLGQRIVAPSMM